MRHSGSLRSTHSAALRYHQTSLRFEVVSPFITLPECTGLMEPNGDALREKAPEEVDHPVLALIRERAAKTARWILIGSLAVKRSDGKIANRSYLIRPDGGINVTYDKIHMFFLFF